MYGDTENAVNLLAAGLADSGVKEHRHCNDISSTHVSTLISEVFRCSHLVLAAPTYNNGVYPAMATFLHDMKPWPAKPHGGLGGERLLGSGQRQADA